ncbi:MAG: hypothetical protein JO272_13165 [Pseudonocardiales bacterium]|nr:hypothetical protein [Pseudonocardiales bacterium]
MTIATNSRSGSLTNPWIVVTTGQGHTDGQVRQPPDHEDQVGDQPASRGGVVSIGSLLLRFGGIPAHS